jgi:hypothetical protein
MDCPAGAERDDAAEGGEERYNTRSTFETSKYNSCKIRRQLKHLKYASETLKKHSNIQIKHMQRICETYATPDKHTYKMCPENIGCV